MVTEMSPGRAYWSSGLLRHRLRASGFAAGAVSQPCTSNTSPFERKRRFRLHREGVRSHSDHRTLFSLIR
jgi:hypothetical protein